MKKFTTWKCDVCDAVFYFDTDLTPFRCPDCFSAQEHLWQAGEGSDRSDIKYEDQEHT